MYKFNSREQQITSQPLRNSQFYEEEEENELNETSNELVEKYRNHSNSGGLGPFSRKLNCPLCGADTHTVVEEVPSCKTHCLAAILCITW